MYICNIRIIDYLNWNCIEKGNLRDFFIGDMNSLKKR